LQIADFEGSLRKPLIFKASAGSDTNYQQSYPQKLWICFRGFENQALSEDFTVPGEV